tara:strand:- start:234 stop:440 length:207 start_codon:yes stop_codon:yes gene_type:complete
MTFSTLNSDLFSKDAEGYFQIVDFNQIREIYEIAQDIKDIENSDHRDYLKDIDEVEIEYPEVNFAVGI